MRHRSLSIDRCLVTSVVLLTLTLAGCQGGDRPVRVYAALPRQGWPQEAPVTFDLTGAGLDTVGQYDVAVSIRHDNDYGFANLALVVDLLADDGQLQRRRVDLSLADNYGSWLGSGFGAMYQFEAPVAVAVPVGQLRRVVVWQVMDSVPVLRHIDQLGLRLVKSHR